MLRGVKRLVPSDSLSLCGGREVREDGELCPRACQRFGSVRTSIKTNRFRELLRATRARPLIVAHRGDSFYAPENTLEAARIGWETGADAWEFDVHLSRDGVPVVIHDESLLRTTDVARRFADDPRVGAGFLVSHFDLSEIHSLDAGSWFLDPKGGSRTAAAFGTFELIPPESRPFLFGGRSRAHARRGSRFDKSVGLVGQCRIEVLSEYRTPLTRCHPRRDRRDGVRIPSTPLLLRSCGRGAGRSTPTRHRDGRIDRNASLSPR